MGLPAYNLVCLAPVGAYPKHQFRTVVIIEKMFCFFVLRPLILNIFATDLYRPKIARRFYCQDSFFSFSAFDAKCQSPLRCTCRSVEQHCVCFHGGSFGRSRRTFKSNVVKSKLKQPRILLSPICLLKVADKEIFTDQQVKTLKGVKKKIMSRKGRK